MDRRQRKTRTAIYAAFENLMANEHYSQVTVAQIIERADIGRSTFYAHFETKDELLNQICTEMFDHVFEGVNSCCITHAQLETPNLEGMMAHLLYHLRDVHSGVCGKLLMEREPHFTEYFQDRLGKLMESDMPATPVDVPHDLVRAMLVSSFHQAVIWWFGNSCSADPQDLARWYWMTLYR